MCIKKLERRHGGPSATAAFFTIEETMKRVTDALELGEGDLKRYGCLLPSTIEDIELLITRLAAGKHFDEAYRNAERYKELVRKASEQLSLSYNI